MTSVALPCHIHLAIIGAGPHALTLVTHLLQKRKTMRGRLLVFDPRGTWMSQWHHQFTALEIPHLRSPAVHHPDPNPYALRRFAQSRPQELFPPYNLPGTKLFQDFCQEVIGRWQLQNCVYPAQVVRVEPLQPSKRGRFCLELSDGKVIVAKRVVIASGGGVPHLPDWVEQIATHYPPDRLLHSTQVDLQGLALQGERILIIGGGLTSGHLAVGAIQRGAKVLLMARRNVYEKLFDADAGWLGPKYLKDFWAEPNWQSRAVMIQQARNGGSMTPAMLTQLRRLEREGRIVFYENCQVTKAGWQEGWQVECNHPQLHECIHTQKIDRIWLATGIQLDVATHPLLKDVLQTVPVEVVNGMPVVDPSLCWQGCELFVMGGLAALQVGPTARNLSGARIVSERIVRQLR